MKKGMENIKLNKSVSMFEWYWQKRIIKKCLDNSNCVNANIYIKLIFIIKLKNTV